MAPRLSIWNGININPQYQNMGDIWNAIQPILESAGSGPWDVEWLVKAGEGGSYQAQFDNHPLAIDSPGKLGDLQDQANGLGFWVTPYFVVRARPEWLGAEIAQISDCLAQTGRGVLNLEPGGQYYNGALAPAWIEENYIGPLWDETLAKTSEHIELEVATIPRDTQVNELGGAPCLKAWRDGATSMSWECYCLMDFASEVDNLCPNIAIPRTNNYVGYPRRKGFHIPIVQKDDLGNWAQRYRSAYGIQVWHLDGN